MPVYFARIEGDAPDAPVKIGFAADPKRRRETMQSAHYRDFIIFRVVEGTRADEKRLHKRFQWLRVRGEWFRYSDAMMGPLGLADLPCPAIPLPTMRGVAMPEHHRQAISAGLKAAHLRGTI